MTFATQGYSDVSVFTLQANNPDIYFYSLIVGSQQSYGDP